MNMTIRIKVHDVFHDPEDFKASDIEDRMIKMCLDDRVEDVRIAKGNANSPLFITLSEDTSSLSFDDAKSIARQLLRQFERRVSGVDVDTTINDRNLKIKN